MIERRPAAMKTVDEMYPDLGEEPFDGPWDYGPMLSSIGTIVVRVDDDDYEGDSRVLYRDSDRWGFLQFGWGSCSGCDALQGCASRAEIETMRDDLAQNVTWGTREQMIAYLRGKDHQTDATYVQGVSERFVRESLAALGDSAQERECPRT